MATPLVVARFCLKKKDVMVGCCCAVCGARSNVFHSSHNCSRMVYLFASVGWSVLMFFIVLLKSCILALSISCAVGSSNLMLLCGSQTS